VADAHLNLLVAVVARLNNLKILQLNYTSLVLLNM
jgi:hypothetical protein